MKGKARPTRYSRSISIALLRDYNGVIQYLLLADQGVMSTPQLASGKHSVQESEDGDALDINQVVYRLTEDAKFQDVKAWKIATSQLVREIGSR